jgi:hypothetical protein
LISGANNPQYTITAAGCYGITVTDTMGCSVESDTLCIVPVGISEMMQNGAAMLLHSPGNNPQLMMLKEFQDARLEVFDMAGRTMYSRSLRNERIIDLNNRLSNGVYTLRLTGKNLNLLMRFAITG